MAREILFRGKRTDNGEWGEGFYEKYNGGDYLNVQTDKLNSGGYPIREFVEVIPETVGQYTGLRDKNGRKIFEGDIVVTNKFCTPDIKYIVEYDVDIATYIGAHKQGCVKHFTTFSGDADEFEIVGNIHDNPEMMEGKQDG